MNNNPNTRAQNKSAEEGYLRHGLSIAKTTTELKREIVFGWFAMIDYGIQSVIFKLKKRVAEKEDDGDGEKRIGVVGGVGWSTLFLCFCSPLLSSSVSC